MNSRRGLLTTLGVVALAGCTTQGDTEPNANQSAGTGGTTDDSTQEGGSSDPDQDLTGEQIHQNWINGDEGRFLEEAENSSIDFDDIDDALENNNGDQVEGVANAFQTASQQYTQTETTYEHRHKVITSAINKALNDHEELDFDILTNINYTQTVGETIQYSEIKVETGETTETGHQEYSIINAALTPETNHATHTPGEQTEDGYKRTMQGVRDSSNGVDKPANDVEAMEQSGSTEEGMATYAHLMGYQLFDGGHEVDSNYEFKPDELLIPTEEAHDTIDNIGYEQGERTGENGDPLQTHGRVDLQLAINEQYFNEGYDETDNPVVISNIEESENGWDFELQEDPDWTPEQGYPEPTA